MTAALIAVMSLSVVATIALLGWFGAARRANWLQQRLDILDRFDLSRELDRRPTAKVVPLFDVRGGKVTQIHRTDLPPRGAA